MQFNSPEQQAAKTAFNQLPDQQRNQMRLSSVRLTNGNFTGSGVLVKDSENIIGIITAKHNLSVKAGIETPIQWNQNQVNELMAGFLNGLSVGYDPQGIDQNPQKTQALTSTNSDIEFRAGNESWDYDLMFISFKGDLEIKQWASSNGSHRIDYPYGQVPQFYKNTQALIDKQVFVTGFGDILNQNGQPTSPGRHPFQVRSATVSVQTQNVLRHQNPNAYFDNVLTVTASNNTSTAPGDSGGPVFYIDRGKVYLLGATLGSNYKAGEIIDDNPIKCNNSTFLYYQGKLF